MKANNGKGNNINRDDWETPQELWDKLHKQYNFKYDCCATFNNRKTFGFTDDFLSISSLNNKVSWINPPFSKADIMIKHFFKVVNKGVGIYRIDNIETNLWYFILNKTDWVFIIKGRINYKGHKGTGSRFGSALFGIGVLPPKNVKGVCVTKF